MIQALNNDSLIISHLISVCISETCLYQRFTIHRSSLNEGYQYCCNPIEYDMKTLFAFSTTKKNLPCGKLFLIHPSYRKHIHCEHFHSVFILRHSRSHPSYACFGIWCQI